MKTTSILLLLIALCTELHGQGTFIFGNKIVNAPVFDAIGELLAGDNLALTPIHHANNRYES